MEFVMKRFVIALLTLSLFATSVEAGPLRRVGKAVGKVVGAVCHRGCN